jgi:YgiT-type zinc finger domain-containing protein
MKCMYCQAEMRRGAVPFHIDRKGVHVSLDEVAAWVCPQCGESFFRWICRSERRTPPSIEEERFHRPRLVGVGYIIAAPAPSPIGTGGGAGAVAVGEVALA